MTENLPALSGPVGMLTLAVLGSPSQLYSLPVELKPFVLIKIIGIVSHLISNKNDIFSAIESIVSPFRVRIMNSIDPGHGASRKINILSEYCTKLKC